MEIGLKKALLKPVVYGLVHSESAASLITELIDTRRSLDRFKNQLLAMLSDVVVINVSAFIQPGAARELVHEIQLLKTGGTRSCTAASVARPRKLNSRSGRQGR